MSFSCLDCGRYFRSSRGLDSHCDALSHDGLWECCNRRFYSSNALDSHTTHAPAHRPKWECCGRTFWSETAWEQHTSTAASHRTCNICNVVFATVDGFEKHWRKKHTRKQAKLVNCNFCDRSFKSPSAYAQHIESGIHGVNRHQVTQAVHTLRVIPQITLAPTLEYNTTSRIEAVEADDWDYTSFQGFQAAAPHVPEILVDDAPPAPVEPGPPLNVREEEAALAPVVEPSTVPTTPTARPTLPATTTTAMVPARFGPDRLYDISGPTTYVPGDFINQGIPYACPICLKTFRNVFALTSHMNSPVHDPDAFLCPKCNKNFRLVSGLIQHLESGTCGLASPAEIHDRFAMLTARFSRLLTV